MKTLSVVHLIDESTDRRLGVREIAVLLSIDLLDLQCLDKTFGPRIVVRIAGSTHADRDAIFFQSLHILSARVLKATIGMMDQAWNWLPLDERRFQCLLSHTTVQATADVPSHHTSRIHHPRPPPDR